MPMPFRYVLALSCMLAFSTASGAEGLWGPQGFAGFSKGLPPATPSVLSKATKNYWTILQNRAQLDLGRVRVLRFADIDPLLDRATRSGLGTLDLFTQPELADPSSAALLLDGPTLRQIDAKYDLSGVWMISARTSMADHRAMTMDYLIVGQGKLIIGYPYESTVEVMDQGKPLEYRYEPFIEASIVNRAGQQGLFDVKSLKDPAGEFQPFLGPMGAAVKSFQVEGSSVLVNYSLGFDQQAHSDKTPIALKRAHLAQTF